MNIRQSSHSDHEALLNVHRQAFGDVKGQEIAKLVDDLFTDETAEPILSLVATQEGEIVGHVLFTKVTIEPSDRPVSAQILAPLAVLPGVQGSGIGESLINEGIRVLRDQGVELLFVLGHPSYYPRCGFAPAGERGFDAPYPIPEEHSAAWMVQSLNGDALGTVKGTVRCSDVLNEPQHWRE